MPYKRLFYHFIWTTKGRMPFITPEIENAIFPVIREKINELGGFTYAIGGVEDHVHLAVSVPVTVTVAEFIRNVKGISSHIIRQKQPETFNWQNEYGVLTFARPDLNRIIDYIDYQKQHHAAKTLIADLEQLT